jgi:hypothetical protein
VYDIKLILLLFVGLLFFQQNSFAQLPTVKTSVDSTNILIGQRINYHVQASMPDNTYRLTWFFVPDSFGNFVPIIRNKIDTTFSNGTWTFSQDIVITSFDSGRQVIPPLTLTASTLDSDSTFNLFTDSVAVNVGYSPADSILPFHDIKNIIEVKKSFPWWAWILAGIAILLAIIWFVFLRKFFKKKKEVTIFESKLSPYDEAMHSLSDLEKENLPAQNKPKEYYWRLTDIFKRYLSRKTNTYQMHLTADEVLIELGGLDISKQQISEFANVLRMSNVVKFAKYIPPAYENEKAFSQTKEMITAINNIKKPENAV